MIYTKDYIPLNTPYLRRNGIVMEATTLTLHNTANPTSSARNERGWLTNPSNTRRASFHIAVDEREAVECIPLNEVALHAGTAEGNRSSIGIEICESGNYAVTLENAVTLVAKMLYERKWGVDRLRRHFDWSGKNCPHLMYDNGTWSGWVKFKNRVAAKLSEMEGPKVDDKIKVIVNGKGVEGGRMIGGSVYVPLRAVGAALGVNVTWDNPTKTATVTK